jgi:hypothetical protein
VGSASPEKVMPSLEEQVDHLTRLLHALSPAQCASAKTLREFMREVRGIPQRFFTDDFFEAVATRFNVDVNSIRGAGMNGNSSNIGTAATLPTHFETLIPSTGFLRDYVEYTRETEPPTVFHFFAALTVLGATLGRRVHFPKGSGDMYPNICVVFVAPPGKCKKTTACNIATSLLRTIGGNVLADKATPEAIIEGLKAMGSNATGLIYAREWSVFLGRQQYMDGMVPMLTDLFDCPDTWTSSTIVRGVVTLNNVAISHLACTTIDWMQKGISKDAMDGGFMSRLLFVIQYDTPRSFSIPPPLNPTTRKSLVAYLLTLQQCKGAMSLTPDAFAYYDKWYTDRSKSASAIEKYLTGYFERKPDRLLQLSMVLALAEDPKQMVIDTPLLKQANAILGYLEQFMPDVFTALDATMVGDAQTQLLSQIRNAGGAISHSRWLRMNTSKMDSQSFRKYVDTLLQAKLIVFDNVHRKYYTL